MSEDDFTPLEKEIIKSLKKEVFSKDDIDLRLAYYKTLFEPALDLAEKAVKQYTKIIKAADTNNTLEEGTIVYRIVNLFENDLMNRIDGVLDE